MKFCYAWRAREIQIYGTWRIMITLPLLGGLQIREAANDMDGPGGVTIDHDDWFLAIRPWVRIPSEQNSVMGLFRSILVGAAMAATMSPSGDNLTF